MRTKTLLLSAAVGVAGLVAASAQTVYSVNSVGYINLSVPTGFSMIANQLDNGTGNLVPDILTVPDGTVIFKYNPSTSGYDNNTFLFGSWTDPNMTLDPGEGVFINNSSGAAIGLTFVGEVPQNAASNGTVGLGFSISASKVPQAGGVVSELEFPAGDGDVVFKFNNTLSAYENYTFLFGSWSPAEPAIAVGESFFVNKQVAAAWDRDFSVNN
jgi:hypothetical protein